VTGSGQKRRFGDVRATSALPPKTDIHREGRHVSNVPRADIRVLAVGRALNMASASQLNVPERLAFCAH